MWHFFCVGIVARILFVFIRQFGTVCTTLGAIPFYLCDFMGKESSGAIFEKNVKKCSVRFTKVNVFLIFFKFSLFVF